MRIRFYNTKRNTIPVIEFIGSLTKRDRARMLASLKTVEDMGLNSLRVKFRQIKNNLWEIKIQGADSSYRIFYVILHGNTMVLLHAYKKQSQKAPIKEIEIAEKRLLEVKENEHNYT